MKICVTPLLASLLMAVACIISVSAEGKVQTTNSIYLNNFDIIAHRGASGFLPEHTKEAAILGFMQGADYIEQDLVATKDNHLVVLHDIYLEAVTNVETVFTDRKRDDGHYYVIDFSLEELRRLRVHERENTQQQKVFPSRYKGNAHFSIATFGEQVELIQHLNGAFGKNVGLYPEIKAPTWHRQQGIDITALLVEELIKHDLNKATTKIYLQSFDPNALQRLRHEFKVKPKLIQLIASKNWARSPIDFNDIRSREGLEIVSQYADGIGLPLQQVINTAPGKTTEVVNLANTLGLRVHAYTFRSDVISLTHSPEHVFMQLKQSGIQGVFTDQVMPYMLDKKTN